jgi:hypothetical protein
MLDELDPEADLHGDLDSCAIDFAISVAGAGLGSIHVTSEFGGNDGAASFPSSRSDTNATEKWVERDLHGEVRILGLEGSFIAGFIDWVGPFQLGDWAA